MSETSFEQLAEEYFTGNRCPGCKQLVLARGCRCKLDRLYSQDELEVQAWLDSLTPEQRNPGRGVKHPVNRIKLDPAIRSALTRRRRQCGLQDIPAATDNPVIGGLDCATDARLGLERQLGVKPKWVKPTSIKTARADREPL